MTNRSGIEKRQQWDGNNIRALRNHLGLTQRELAEQLGTRQQTISEWEKGLYRPRGTSSTLLTIVAERAQFEYQPHSRDENKKD
jgi:DNA-binding transcriptional regulator YiaG